MIYTTTLCEAAQFRQLSKRGVARAAVNGEVAGRPQPRRCLTRDEIWPEFVGLWMPIAGRGKQRPLLHPGLPRIL